MANGKFNRSQEAHAKLNREWQSKGNTDKNRAYGNYHADCLDQQRAKGRILTKSERKKMFAWWWDYEVNGKHGKYPSLK